MVSVYIMQEDLFLKKIIQNKSFCGGKNNYGIRIVWKSLEALKDWPVVDRTVGSSKKRIETNMFRKERLNW